MKKHSQPKSKHHASSRQNSKQHARKGSRGNDAQLSYQIITLNNKNQTLHASKEASYEQVSEAMLDADGHGEGENYESTIMALKRSPSAEIQERKKRAQHNKHKK